MIGTVSGTGAVVVVAQNVQNSLFLGENVNACFLTLSSTPDPVTLELLELVPN